MTRIIENASASAAQQKAQKCLACGYLNRNAEDSCSACGSSLQLKLCGACEAINASRAESCHACGTAFAASGEARRLPVTVEASAAAAPAPRNRQLAALIALPIAATLGLAYYVYGGSLLGSKHSATQPEAGASQAQHPVAPSAPQPIAKSTAQPAVETAERAPVRTPMLAAPAPAAQEPPRHIRVTHTKGPMKDDDVSVTTPSERATAGAMSVRAVSGAETPSEACSDAVAALGFCTKQAGR